MSKHDEGESSKSPLSYALAFTSTTKAHGDSIPKAQYTLWSLIERLKAILRTNPSVNLREVCRAAEELHDQLESSKRNLNVSGLLTGVDVFASQAMTLIIRLLNDIDALKLENSRLQKLVESLRNDLTQMKTETGRRHEAFEMRIRDLESQINFSGYQSLFVDWISQFQGAVANKVEGIYSLDHLQHRLDIEGIKTTPSDEPVYGALLPILESYGWSFDEWKSVSSIRQGSNTKFHKRGLITPTNVTSLLREDAEVLSNLTSIDDNEKGLITKLMHTYEKMLHFESS